MYCTQEKIYKHSKIMVYKQGILFTKSLLLIAIFQKYHNGKFEKNGLFSTKFYIFMFSFIITFHLILF